MAVRDNKRCTGISIDTGTKMTLKYQQLISSAHTMDVPCALSYSHPHPKINTYLNEHIYVYNILTWHISTVNQCNNNSKQNHLTVYERLDRELMIQLTCWARSVAFEDKLDQSGQLRHHQKSHKI